MGPLMLDVSAYELSAEEREMLDHPLVGGVILFSRNFHDVSQVTELNRQIREAARNQLMLAVDHEGGRVQRFKEGFSKIPAMASLYERAAGDMEKASEFAFQFGWLMAAEVQACDIDISFAPVLDIRGVSEVIGDRSFHEQPEIITQLASRFVEGMHKAGMKSTGKHFPGHGNVKEDSHIALPIDRRSKDEIVNYDMRIFEQLHNKGLLDAVMPAHVIYPAVDKLPAGFSPVWIREYLRNQMNFDGVVFSDDLSMEGATHIGNFSERAVAALEAGCDMVLVCNNPKGAAEVLDSLPIDYQASDRLPRMLKQEATDMETLKSGFAHKHASELLSEFYAE